MLITHLNKTPTGSSRPKNNSKQSDSHSSHGGKGQLIKRIPPVGLKPVKTTATYQVSTHGHKDGVSLNQIGGGRKVVTRQGLGNPVKSQSDLLG